MDTIYRYYAAMRGTRRVPAYVTQCGAILSRMGTVTKLQSPLLAQAQADLSALASAEQAAHKGTPALTADRNSKLAVVRSDMHQLKAFVQSVADADPTNAQALIEASGMSVAKRTIRVKPELAAKPGKVTTTATLYARAVKRRVSYQWQMSLDQKTWNGLPDTMTSKTSVTGLTPATVYYFRFRTLTTAGLSDWSMVASLIAQ